jgi:hypothetical protein
MQWELLSVANREPMKLDSASLNSVFYITECTIGDTVLKILFRKIFCLNSIKRVAQEMRLETHINFGLQCPIYLPTFIKFRDF